MSPIRLFFFLLAVCFSVAIGAASSGGRVVCQEVSKRKEKALCQGQICATITGTIDDRKLPPRKGRPFLITLAPAPYGDSVATVVSSAGDIFTLPPQKPGSYLMRVSGYTNECDIQWKKKLKLRAGETKIINPRPRIVPVSGCE